jgi:electron transport complex protein RnfC
VSEQTIDIRPIAPSEGNDDGRLGELLGKSREPGSAHFAELFRTAGVGANRWTSPDLDAQLSECVKRPPDTVVCNALDFDDALPLQRTVLRERASDVAVALAALATAVGAKSTIIAFDDGDEGARRAIRRCAAERPDVRTAALRNDYPQSNPTLLLHTLLRRRLRPGHLPTDAGVLLIDAVAAAVVGGFLRDRDRPGRVPVGIADMRVGRERTPHLLDVPIGTRADGLARQVLQAHTRLELRASSPLREIKLSAEHEITMAGEVVFYVLAPQPMPNPNPCIRCGWCVSGCPVNIHPAGILQAAQANDTGAAEEHGIAVCIECGVCSYVCPSNLPLLGGIRTVRATSAGAIADSGARS